MLDLEQSSVDQAIVSDALRVVETAEKRGVVLRLLGALAIALHSKDFIDLQRSLKRLGDAGRTFTDIDLIGYGKQRVHVREVMEDALGYSVDQNVLLFRGKERLLYRHPGNLYQIDIFFDNLKFSHDIAFGTDPSKGRLRLDYPTISPTDLVLEKLQIHSISEKDLKDMIVLLRAHNLGLSDNQERIDTRYVAVVLSDDWGFWKDATTNLRDVVSYGEKYLAEGMISTPDFSDVSNKVARIIETVDREPKTLKWKLRQRTGETKEWWNSVEDVSR